MLSLALIGVVFKDKIVVLALALCSILVNIPVTNPLSQCLLIPSFIQRYTRTAGHNAAIICVSVTPIFNEETLLLNFATMSP